jgi:hypothetical protein
MKERKPTARRLARINRRITRLSSELETLQYIQDRLSRDLDGPSAPIRKNAMQEKDRR